MKVLPFFYLIAFTLLIIFLILWSWIGNAEANEDIVSVVWIDKNGQWIIAKLTLVPTRDDLPRQCREATACYLHWDLIREIPINEIWIVEGAVWWPQKLGCNTLWHEILHGKGLDHGAMKQKYDNWVCAIGSR